MLYKEGYFSIRNFNEIDIYYVNINVDYISDIINLLLNDKNAIVGHCENVDETEFLKFHKNDVVNLKEKACFANRMITINDKTFGTKYLTVKSLKSFDVLEKDASIIYNLLIKLLKEKYQYISKIINYQLQNSYIDSYYEMTKSSIETKYLETRNIDEIKEETEKAKTLIKKNKLILKGV